MLDGTARLSGHYVDLVPVTRLDYEFIFKLEVLGPSSAHYRFHGITPSPDRFPELVWEGVLAQYVLMWKRDRSRIGTVMCYRPDFRASHARIGSALIPAPPSPFALEGFVIFLDHIFDTYDFHKLYGEALEPNLGHFRSAIGSIMHSEGRLRHHEYVNGGYQDLHLLAI